MRWVVRFPVSLCPHRLISNPLTVPGWLVDGVMCRISLHHHSPWRKPADIPRCVTFRHPHPPSHIKRHISSRVREKKIARRKRRSLAINALSQRNGNWKGDESTSSLTNCWELKAERMAPGCSRASLHRDLPKPINGQRATNFDSDQSRRNLCQHVGVETDPCPFDMAHGGRSTSPGCELFRRQVIEPGQLDVDEELGFPSA